MSTVKKRIGLWMHRTLARLGLLPDRREWDKRRGDDHDHDRTQ